MKAHNLKSVDSQGHLYGYAASGRKERVTMMVIAPGIDEWRLIGHLQGKGEYAVLSRGDLRHVVLEAEELKARHPGVPFAAPYLQPAGIHGHQRQDVRRQGGWAIGVTSKRVDFANADLLYHHLRAEGYLMFGNQALKEGQDTRTWLFCSYENPTSHTAWEIAHHRLENGGALPPNLEVPAGTCPQCLSRHVVMPLDGSGYHCQECHYVG